MIRECLVTRDYCVCSRGASFFLNTRFWFTVCSFSPKLSTTLHKNTNKQEHINAKIKICAHIFLEFKNLRLGVGEAGGGERWPVIHQMTFLSVISKGQHLFSRRDPAVLTWGTVMTVMTLWRRLPIKADANGIPASEAAQELKEQKLGPSHSVLGSCGA